MLTKLSLAGIVGALVAGAALANDPESEPVPIKPREQIRCELMGDCPITRGTNWVSNLGEIESSKVKPKPRLAEKREIKTKPGSAGPRGLSIVPVQQSPLFINFPMGSWEINDAAYEQVSELFKALTPEEWGKYRFEIAGHTDALGSAAENEELSKKRAQAVVNLLVARGIESSQLVPKGYGFRRPIEGLDRLDARNRRVEIIKVK